ncbi:DUF2255 family protein [Kineococcus sp. NUM-3379]
MSLLTRRGDVWTSRQVWVVTVAGWAYVRSAFGTRAVWYRRVLTDPHARVVAGDLIFDVGFVPVRDALTVAEVSVAYWEKYGLGWPGPTAGMTAPEAACTTMRLVGGPAAHVGDDHRGEATASTGIVRIPDGGAAGVPATGRDVPRHQEEFQ